MTLNKFEHISASSLKEATVILSQAKGKASVIAGGTDLLGVLKDKIHSETPEVLVDLKTIPKLSYVTEDKKGIRIGALTTLKEIITNKTIKAKYNLLAEAALSVASPQIRNMGTLGGNICQEPRCWYYRTPDDLFHCLRKGGNKCGALFGENRYHSIFGSVRAADPACAQTCPANTEIPAYMSHVRKGDLRGAARVILSNNPIPAITGRVCPHFCESECNRSEFDEAVSIRNVERVVGDYILDHAAELMKPPKKQIKKTVAIVGAGPAGLSAAFYLRKEGYQITIFDKMPEAGGMLTYCIPSYRLSREVLRKQIKCFEDMGIKFKLNASVGKKGMTLKDLRKKFDYVFLATGAWRQQTFNIEKSKLLTSGLDLLIAIALGKKPPLGDKVIVIGGGNVAVDVARSIKRLGASEVTIVYRRTKAEMPASEEEVADALDDGVNLLQSFAPHRILEKNGKITGMEFVAGASEFGGGRSARMVLDYSKKKTIKADQIILAIGQSTDLSFADKTLKTERGLITVDDEANATNLPDVYAGGDVTIGPASVIQAVAGGRKAAMAIAKIKPESHLSPGQPLDMHYDCHNKSERTKNISNASDIRSEAERCVNCGCVAVNVSDMAPALIALEAKIKTTKRTIRAEKFFTATIMKSTVLEEDELVKEVAIPAPKQKNKQGYLKFRIRNSIDFPIVSLAYAFSSKGNKLQDAKVVLGAVAPTPLRIKAVEDFVKGKPANEATAVAAGDLAVREVQALSKNKFKVQIVRALLKKMLM